MDDSNNEYSTVGDTTDDEDDYSPGDDNSFQDTQDTQDDTDDTDSDVSVEIIESSSSDEVESDDQGPLHDVNTPPSIHSNRDTRDSNNVDEVTAAAAAVAILDIQIRLTPSPLRRNSDSMDPEAAGKSEEPQSKKAKCGSSQENERESIQNKSVSDDGTSCPVCFDSWTSTGEHRLVSLKCGHLFGKNCIEKWLDGEGRKARCPQCNSRAKLSDIRPLFTRNLKALDTEERERHLRELEEERLKKNQLEDEKNGLKVKLTTLEMENERLKRELLDRNKKLQYLVSSNKRQMIEQKVVPPNIGSDGAKFTLFTLATGIKLVKSDDCRPLMSSSKCFETIVVSQPSSNRLFPGYGIRKFNSSDLKQSEFIFVHKKPVKDICFKPNDMLVLSTSMDKTLKLTSLMNHKCLITLELEHEGWSCCFNPENSNSCYVGLKNGTISEYDIRYNHGSVRSFGAVDYCPLISVQYIQPQDRKLPFGLLSTSLQKCSFYELNPSGALQQNEMIPIEGRFLPSHYDPESGYSLVSCRPSAKHTNITHSVCIIHAFNISL